MNYTTLVRGMLTWKRVKAASKKPKSKLRRVADALTLTAMLAYLLVLCFPQMLFAYSASSHNFRVYSTSPISSSIYPILDKADHKFTASEIYDPQCSYHIFLCPSHASFAFFCPLERTAFALNVGLVHNIFVNTANVAADKIVKGSGKYDQRILSDTVAHECTHTLLAKRFGQVRIPFLPRWKQEGYCEYVAQGTTLDTAEGLRLLKQDKNNASPSFFYFKAFTAVSYLKDKKHWSITQIMDTPLDLDTVVRESLPQKK